MDRYAVLGNPIKHSLSPRIHTLFAAQTGQMLSYVALEAPLDGFTAFVARLHQEGYRGLNVTVPFKTEAFALSEHRSERAARAQAVNTLIRTETGFRGDNTDGIGLLRDLTQNLGLDISAQRVLLLGAGGAARGAIAPLLAARPARIHIANRTASTAKRLAADFANLGPIDGSGFDGPFKGPFDLIVNATAASLQGELPPLPAGLIGANTICYDMMYANEPTAFMRWGQAQGAARCVDGLGMLVEQAAEAFFLWREVLPDTASVLAQLRPGNGRT
ncbi:MAG: shikimate dehydrogenase [Thiotrichales bacterium]